MDDVQGYRDDRGIQLDQAGVSDLLFPIIVLDAKISVNKQRRNSNSLSALHPMPKAPT